MKIPFLLIVGTLLISSLGAQGLQLDDGAYNDVLLQPTFGQKGNAEEKVLSIDLRPYCPPAQNQGRDATCTGWAVGYAALSIEHAVRENIQHQPDQLLQEAFSAHFVYNQIKDKRLQGCSALSSIEDALELLKSKGNIRHQAFDQGGCERIPSGSLLQEASLNKIKEFRRLFKLDVQPKAKIKAVKKSLSRKHPVIVGMFIKKSLYNQMGQDFWYPGPGPVSEAHAMVVVGFDEGKGRKGAFLLMNSWGQSWGKNGFIWVSYEDFGELCTRAYELSLAEKRKADPKRNKTLEGRVSLQRIQLGDSIRYKRANPVYQNLYYRFPGERWEVNDLFQINVSDVTDEKYLYAFSYDAKGELTVHFPRDHRIDEKFGDQMESGIITSPEDLLTLPSATVAFQLEKAGDEYICLLFSPEPIQDFPERIRSVKSSSKPFPRAFAIYFGDLLFTSSSVFYEREEMRYYSKLRMIDKCIPVLLKINVEGS